MAASFSSPSHFKCHFSSVFSRTKSLSHKNLSPPPSTPTISTGRAPSSSGGTRSPPPPPPPSQLPLASKIQSGFEPRKSSSTSASFDADDQHRPRAPSSHGTRSPPPPSQLPLASKVQRLADNVQLARPDYLELRQEASELQEYSNTKLNRVTRYLGVLADKKPKLDQVALEGEARIAPLVCENRKLFTELLTSKE